jgi:hypothetical protein
VAEGEGDHPYDQHNSSPCTENPIEQYGNSFQTSLSSRSPDSFTSSDSEEVDAELSNMLENTAVFCSTDAHINDILTNLHLRLKQGHHGVQREIDTYLLLCACEKSLSGRALLNMKVSEACVAQYGTLPDLTRYLPFSFTMTREVGIIAYYIQLLSPLKRKTRTRRGNPTAPLCPTEACVCLNLIQATLLGLYPRSSKQPLWRTRVAIVACIHKLQTSSFETQTHFLAMSHDILRVSFTEYILNVRSDYCPVENEFLVRQACFLPNYDTACVTLCDHIRQTCVQSKTWSWSHINSVSATSLDRISRMCRTRVTSTNTQTPVLAMAPGQLQAAMQQHVIYPDPNTHNCVTMTNTVEQALHTRMLPWNMVKAQSARIVGKFSHTLFPITAVCERHICIKCVLTVTSRMMPRVSKLRMNTSNGTLTCANCNSVDTVVKVNLLGKLLNIRKTGYFACQECTSLHEYDPVNPLMCTRHKISLPMFDPHNVNRSWTGGIEIHGAMAVTTELQKRKAEDNIVEHIKPAPTRDRKHRCKWCGRVCSARNMVLLHQASVSIVSMTLCFKHMPPQHMIGMIQDTRALVRYITASIESK